MLCLENDSFIRADGFGNLSIFSDNGDDVKTTYDSELHKNWRSLHSFCNAASCHKSHCHTYIV